MNAIYSNLIRTPSAWTTDQLGGKPGVARQLTPDEIAAIDERLAATAALGPHDVTRENFRHPRVDALMEEVRLSIFDGRAATIIQGLPRERYSEEQCERIFWGLGTHLGKGEAQSVKGDRLGRVEADPRPTHFRGYRSTQELAKHTDSYEVVGLMCVNPALSGGYTTLASALAIHNEIQATRPELLAPLYEGSWYISDEAMQSGAKPTAVRVPVFSQVDGVVSCVFAQDQMRNAARAMGRDLSPAFEEALSYFVSLAESDKFSVKFLLEPGEMMLWHNFTLLHSRTSFENGQGRNRLLLRLWISAYSPRPAVPAVSARADTYRRLREEAVAQAASAN